MTKQAKSSPHDVPMQVYVAMLILSELRTGTRTGTIQIKAALEARGIHRSTRTIQRTLRSLSTRFPIECDTCNPMGWRWRRSDNTEIIEMIDMFKRAA